LLAAFVCTVIVARRGSARARGTPWCVPWRQLVGAGSLATTDRRKQNRCRQPRGEVITRYG